MLRYGHKMRNVGASNSTKEEFLIAFIYSNAKNGTADDLSKAARFGMISTDGRGILP